MIDVQRRRLFTGLAGLFVAPAIVRADSLMKVVPLAGTDSLLTGVLGQFDSVVFKWPYNSEAIRQIGSLIADDLERMMRRPSYTCPLSKRHKHSPIVVCSPSQLPDLLGNAHGR